MNRENKRKLYDKHYYKTHPCDDAFTCKHCGRLVVPEGAGSDHRTIALTACAPFTLTTPPRPRSRLRRADGTHRRVGAQKRRMGAAPPLSDVRHDSRQPRRGG